MRRLRHRQGQAGATLRHARAGTVPERDYSCGPHEHEDRRHTRQLALDDHRGWQESQENCVPDEGQVRLDEGTAEVLRFHPSPSNGDPSRRWRRVLRRVGDRPHRHLSNDVHQVNRRPTS